MEKYHLRRKDREISQKEEIQSLLHSQAITTISMCSNGKPYLITLDYVYDENNGALYFHSAREGKKIDILKKNPSVWGQVLEDLGYIKNECSHAYRSIHYEGDVSFISDLQRKKEILIKMIKKFESNSESFSQRFLKDSSLESVAIGKIKIKNLTGKENFE